MGCGLQAGSKVEPREQCVTSGGGQSAVTQTMCPVKVQASL